MTSAVETTQRLLGLDDETTQLCLVVVAIFDVAAETNDPRQVKQLLLGMRDPDVVGKVVMMLASQLIEIAHADPEKFWEAWKYIKTVPIFTDAVLSDPEISEKDLERTVALRNEAIGVLEEACRTIRPDADGYADRLRPVVDRLALAVQIWTDHSFRLWSAAVVVHKLTRRLRHAMTTGQQVGGDGCDDVLF